SANTNGGLSRFGTGRVRRFAPESSGFTTPRSDTGLVTLPRDNQPRPINSLFQNISNAALNTLGETTFYDAVANVGVVSLLILEPLTRAQSNLLSGFPADGNGSPAPGTELRDIGRYYQQ